MLRWGGCCEGRAEGRQSVRGRLLYNYRNNHFEKRKEKEQNLHFDKLLCFCFGSQAGVRRGQKYLSSISVSVCVLVCVTFCIWPEWGCCCCCWCYWCCRILLHSVKSAQGCKCALLWVSNVELSDTSSRVRFKRGKCANISGIFLGG